jgi:hypothetical protein
MHTLKLSFSLPDATHSPWELRVSSNDSDCDVLIELPARGQSKGAAKPALDTLWADDEYVLGGYAGI